MSSHNIVIATQESGYSCVCFKCVSARYIEGVHCGSCMAYPIVVKSTGQCKACAYKYAQENRVRNDMQNL